MDDDDGIHILYGEQKRKNSREKKRFCFHFETGRNAIFKIDINIDDERARIRISNGRRRRETKRVINFICIFLVINL